MAMHFERDHAKIALQGEVNQQNIRWVIDGISYAVDYYRYPKIKLTIDSPGGSVDYFTQLHDCIEHYKKQSVIFETWAEVYAHSAAAHLVNVGSIGHRYARAGSSMLFHPARVHPAEASALTHQGSQALYQRLANIDDRFLKKTLANIVATVRHRQACGNLWDLADFSSEHYDYLEKIYEIIELPKPEEKLYPIYQRLFNAEILLSPADAQALFLIDHIV